MSKVLAYLVFKIKVQLLSMTSLLQTYPDKTITIEAHQLTLLSGSNDHNTRGQVIARVNPDNNLPTSHTYCQASNPKGLEILNNTITTVSLENANLSEAKKERVVKVAPSPWEPGVPQDSVPDEEYSSKSERVQPCPPHCCRPNCEPTEVRRMPIRRATPRPSFSQGHNRYQGQSWGPHSREPGPRTASLH